jgi:DNA primase
LEDLIEKVDIVEYISQYVNLTLKGQEYVGLSPFTNEKTPSFFVHPVKKLWYCFSCGEGGNVIQFAKKYHKVSYEQAVKMICSWAHLLLTNEEPILKIIRHYKKKEKEEELAIRAELNPNIMEQYKDITIQSWINEGIPREILKKYNVRYDDKACRIVFPVWDIEGKIINIKGRAAHPKWKEFGMAKYIYYYPLGKNDIFWGYHWHIDDILKKNEIILVEGEKSVMKLEANGVNNAVAIATSHLSKPQTQILMRLHVDVVVALDKDKDPTKDKNLVNLARYNNCYIMVDNNNLLGEKDSPIDKGINIFNIMYNERRKI